MPIETARKLVADAMRAHVQDSMIVAMQARIEALEAEKARQWVDFNKLMDLERDKFQSVLEMNDHYKAIGDHYKDENRKLKRQNRILKISVGIAFAGGVFLGK